MTETLSIPPHPLAEKSALRPFEDPLTTAKGEARAQVALKALETLWINTGTLCNITCLNCYIESSPKNDRLSYISLDSVRTYLDEIAREALPTRLIGFTGGEPFMNPDFMAMLRETLERGFEALVLTNAMKPMSLHKAGLLALLGRFGARLRLRVSIDDFRESVHDAERGAGSFAQAMAGLAWAAQSGFALEIAGRRLQRESEAFMREGFGQLFRERTIPIDAQDPVALVIFPEMSPEANPPEITEACWGILKKSPDSVMCSSARMVVQRKGAAQPAVLACTLLPYDARFELGATLKDASKPVSLNHRYCATFCVLGGASCGTKKSA